MTGKCLYYQSGKCVFEYPCAKKIGAGHPVPCRVKGNLDFDRIQAAEKKAGMSADGTK